MPDNTNAYYQEILATIEQLKEEYSRLENENVRLKNEVANLKKHASEKPDPSSLLVLDDNKRMALRQQLLAYINRIDVILQKE
ncbi:MAG: hypothetical protein LAT57_11080 [Balneolales bacterium]|nr:hypothetical protein [Balneolales bacterium]